jgi:MFS family permease
MSPTTPSDVENASTSSHTHAAKPEEKDDHREKKTEVLEDATLAFPDGGPQAWLNVLGGWLIMFAASGYVRCLAAVNYHCSDICLQINSFGVYQDYYTRVFMTNKTPSEISWIGSFQLFLIFGMALFAGALFDKGYFHHLLISGTIILVFSFAFRFFPFCRTLKLIWPDNSWCRSQNQSIITRHSCPKESYSSIHPTITTLTNSTGLGAGIGMGLLFLPGLAMLPHWFRRRRALALGIAVSGGSVGGMLTPIMLNQLFNRPSVGFAWGVRAEAFVTLGLLIVVNLIMKPRLPSGKKAREAAKKKQLDIKAIFKDGPYWLACIGWVFFHVIRVTSLPGVSS